MGVFKNIFLGAFLIIAVFSLILGSVESGLAHAHNDGGINLGCTACHWLIVAMLTFFVFTILSIQKTCLSVSKRLIINSYLISLYLRAPPSAA